MRNRTVTVVLGGLTLLLFLAYFTLQNIFITAGQPITNHLDNIIIYARQGEWLRAEQTVHDLQKVWDKT